MVTSVSRTRCRHDQSWVANTGGGTCHLLLGKVVFSLVFLLGCQLPLHSLMLVVGSLSTEDLSVFTGTNCSTLAIPILCIYVFCIFLSSSLRLLISLLLLPCNIVKIYSCGLVMINLYILMTNFSAVFYMFISTSGSICTAVWSVNSCSSMWCLQVQCKDHD